MVNNSAKQKNLVATLITLGVEILRYNMAGAPKKMTHDMFLLSSITLIYHSPYRRKYYTILLQQFITVPPSAEVVDVCTVRLDNLPGIFAHPVIVVSEAYS